jgi:hypothetical protein
MINRTVNHQLIHYAARGPAETVWHTVGERPDAASVPGCSLFHDPRFFGLHADGTRRGTYLTARDGDVIVSVGHALEMEPGEWESPGRGTFGGIQCLGPSVSADTLQHGYAHLEREVRQLGARSLRVTLPPADHQPVPVRLAEETLRARGYALLWTDLNFSVPVTEQPLRERMNRGKRQMVDRARRMGLVGRRLDTDQRAAAHALIADCRARRGWPMTMTLDALITMHDRLPESMIWIGLFADTLMVGAAILMRVRPDVLYLPFAGNHESAEFRGSKELLLDAAYAEAQAGGYRLLDYGIATEQGVPNEGLIDFKTRIGLSPHTRTTWRKTFEDASDLPPIAPLNAPLDAP